MHVLIATLGTRGDVQPMLALALGLRTRGHAVTFCGPSDARLAVETLGVPFVDLGFDARAFLARHPEVVGGRARAMLTTRAALARLIDQQFQTLEPLAGTADVIVGAGAVSAPSSVAEANRIPYRFVAFGSMAIPSRLHPPYLFPMHGLPRIANSALWRLTDVTLRAIVGGALDARRRRLGLASRQRLSRVLTPPGSLLLAADPELSPPPFDYDPAIAVTGSLFASPTPGGVLPPHVESFLAKGPSPVYVGFGSMTDTNPERTTRIVVDAIGRTGVRAIVSSGWAGLGAALPDTCLAVDEMPHDALFSRVAAVVHHGGAGTTATAARAGVPQLLVPHMLDQFYWADRVVTLGIGPRSIPRRSLAAGSLAKRLVALTVDASMRSAARALGERLRGRDGVSGAVEAIESAWRGAPLRRSAPHVR